MMGQCECISEACEIEHHSDLYCTQPARRVVVSRDFGEKVLRMCRFCALDALSSGMFEDQP
jgi:hypothetical protein